MRVLFDHGLPFSFAHGGLQTQVENTIAALRRQGVDADFVRWWEGDQPADLIHYIGRPVDRYVELAKAKGLPVVVAELHGGLSARSTGKRLQKIVKRVAQTTIPRSFLGRLGWNTYQTADAFVALTQCDADLMIDFFGADPAKVHVIPNGIEPVFFDAPAPPKTHWLVCTATITERKRIIETCHTAILAQTPLWIIGRPYAGDDPYFLRFLALVRDHPELIRYEGAIEDRSRLAEALKAARGFVLLSAEETRSISAEEAAACGCPLLLSDQPWARSVFGAHASYLPLSLGPSQAAAILRRFHDACPTLPAPPLPVTWDEVGIQLLSLYRSLL